MLWHTHIIISSQVIKSACFSFDASPEPTLIWNVEYSLHVLRMQNVKCAGLPLQRRWIAPAEVATGKTIFSFDSKAICVALITNVFPAPSKASKKNCRCWRWNWPEEIFSSEIVLCLYRWMHVTPGRTAPPTVLNTAFRSSLNCIVASMTFSDSFSKMCSCLSHWSANGAKFCGSDSNPCDFKVPPINREGLSCLSRCKQLFAKSSVCNIFRALLWRLQMAETKSVPYLFMAWADPKGKKLLKLWQIFQRGIQNLIETICIYLAFYTSLILYCKTQSSKHENSNVQVRTRMPTAHRTLYDN